MKISFDMKKIQSDTREMEYQMKNYRKFIGILFICDFISRDSDCMYTTQKN